jgi:hypothetical protein
MSSTIILGFLVPWLTVGVYLWKKDKKTLFLIYPVGATVALTFNTLGMYFNLWRVKPILHVELVSTIPIDLGYYPLSACFLIYLIRIKYNAIIVLFVFTILTTFLEWTSLVFGKAIFMNGWNIGWTVVSYIGAYTIVYCYHRQLIWLNVN